MYKTAEPQKLWSQLYTQICYFWKPVLFGQATNSDCRSLWFTKDTNEKIIGVGPNRSHVQTRQKLLISFRRKVQPHKSKVLCICLVLLMVMMMIKDTGCCWGWWSIDANISIKTQRSLWPQSSWGQTWNWEWFFSLDCPREENSGWSCVCVHLLIKY